MNDLPLIVLASRSPRRAELLNQAGIRYLPDYADIDESEMPGESPSDYVTRMACEKALAVSSKRTGEYTVLGADTSVVVGGEILGKPRNRDHARELLRLLSGRTHQVYSAVAVVNPAGEVHHCLNISEVTFDLLDDGWIDAYIETGEPMDKAGAYGIQGRAAARISHLEGSYSAVMGLPLFETMSLLNEFGKA
jgi:septum formation protein